MNARRLWVLPTLLSLGSCASQVDVGSVTGSTNQTLQFAPIGPGMCALFDDHEVRCWNAHKPETLQRIVMFSGAKRFATAGTQGQACMITEDGLVKCSDVSFAQPLSQVPGLERAIDVTLGFWGGCALSEDGVVKCWGRSLPQGCIPSDSAWLSGNTDPPPLVASDVVAVPYPRPVVKIRTNDRNTCAMLDDGRVFCHGNSPVGVTSVSDGGSVAVPSCSAPAEVLNINDAVDLAVGSATCILHVSGKVTCMGEARMLGIGSDSFDDARGDAIGIHDAVAIESSGMATCVLTSSSWLRCWGDDLCGSLGTTWSCDTPQIIYVPLFVHQEATFKLIGMSNAHNCGVTLDGKTLCWGFYWSDQLGRAVADPAVYRPY
jgi:hypothetical protein